MKRTDLARLKELKQEGHNLIDEVARRRGITKNSVYKLLQGRLKKNLESSVHFYNIYTVRDAEEAVATLRKMVEAPKKKAVILPLVLQKQAFEPKYISFWWPRLEWARVKLIKLPKNLYQLAGKS
jgi:hypothetical protein